jgi:hypothetical protein
MLPLKTIQLIYKLYKDHFYSGNIAFGVSAPFALNVLYLIKQNTPPTQEKDIQRTLFYSGNNV